MTNLEGRVIRRKQALPPPDGVARRPADARPRWPTDSAAAQYFSRRPAGGLRRAAAGQRRRHRRLRRHHLRADRRRAGRLLALPDGGPPRHAAAVRRRASRPRTAGRRFIRVDCTARRPRRPDAATRYVLTTGRLMAQYQSGTQTRRLAALAWSPPSPQVQMHPDLARRLGIAAGDLVELRTRRGAAVFRAQLTDAHPAGRGLRAVPLGRRVQRQRADRPGARPALQDAGVQGRARSPPSAAGRRAADRSRQPAAPFADRPPLPVRAPARPEQRTDPTCMHTKNRFLQGIYPFTGPASTSRPRWTPS